jgi:Flp pilus assembly protein TadD
MFARISQIRWITAGAAVLAAVGCHSARQDAAFQASSQTMSRLPADVSLLAEARSPEILPDTHVAAGRMHESQGHLARAAEQYRLAIGAQPDHVEAHNRLGIVLDQLGKFQEADQAFARAIRLAPRQAHLRNNLAFSYIMQTRWADAEAELTRALELAPEFARARVNLATVQAQQGRFEEAFENFKRVLREEDAYYNLGLMYQSKRRSAEAAQAFRQALQVNPKLVAAQKRLDLLPPGARSEAERRGPLFAPALAMAGQGGAGDAADGADAAANPPDAGANLATDGPARREIDGDASAGMAVPDAQPAMERLAVDDGFFTERRTDDEWLFSSLVVEPSGPSWQGNRWADAVRLLRDRIEPMRQILNRLWSAESGESAMQASPLPPEVPEPEEETSPLYELSASPDVFR